MKKAAEEHAEEDKEIRERAEKLNKADSLVFSTRKQLDEHGDKISDASKEKIKAALEKVEKLHGEEKVDELDDAMDELNSAWSEASQEIYQSAQQQQAGAEPNGQQQAEGAEASESSGGEDDAVDADFEVVDDDDNNKKS